MKYLSIPFSHPDALVIEARMEAFWKALAYRIAVKGEVVVSPMTLYPMLAYTPDTPTDYNYWGPYSESLLSRCDALYVLTLDGWKESTGVQGEMAYAQAHHIPVVFLSPDTFEKIED